MVGPSVKKMVGVGPNVGGETECKENGRCGTVQLYVETIVLPFFFAISLNYIVPSNFHIIFL